MRTVVFWGRRKLSNALQEDVLTSLRLLLLLPVGLNSPLGISGLRSCKMNGWRGSWLDDHINLLGDRSKKRGMHYTGAYLGMLLPYSVLTTRNSTC